MTTAYDDKSVHDEVVSNEPPTEEFSLCGFEPISNAGKSLLDYWKTLPREDGQAPLFSDCDLLEIADLLPECLLLNFEDEENWPIRIFGTELTMRFGMDVTGLNALETFQPEQRVGVARRIGVLRSRPAILNTVSSFTKENGLRLVSEWVFTPLLGPSGAVEYGLASIAPVEEIALEDRFILDGQLSNRRMLRIRYVSI